MIIISDQFFFDQDILAQNGARKLPGLLFDRWDTIRVRSANKQNVIEIQMLECEQYRRMVDGYKSEQVSPKSTPSLSTY